MKFLEFLNATNNFYTKNKVFAIDGLVSLGVITETHRNNFYIMQNHTLDFLDKNISNASLIALAKAQCVKYIVHAGEEVPPNIPGYYSMRGDFEDVSPWVFYVPKNMIDIPKAFNELFDNLSILENFNFLLNAESNYDLHTILSLFSHTLVDELKIKKMYEKYLDLKKTYRENASIASSSNDSRDTSLPLLFSSLSCSSSSSMDVEPAYTQEVSPQLESKEKFTQ